MRFIYFKVYLFFLFGWSYDDCCKYSVFQEFGEIIMYVWVEFELDISVFNIFFDSLNYRIYEFIICQ